MPFCCALPACVWIGGGGGGWRRNDFCDLQVL